MRGAELARQCQLLRREVDRDDRVRLAHARAEQRGEADATEADDRDAAMQRQVGGVDHGAGAGDHGAAEHGRMGEVEAAVDPHHRVARHGRIFGERRDAEVMVHVGTRAMQATRAADQRAGRVGGGARLAERGPARFARAAVPAARHERRDDVVADLQVGDARAELLDDARALVAEHHRQRPRPVAVDHREVGMAEADRAHLQQHLARARRVELDVGDLERLRFGVGRRCAHAGEDGGACFHGFNAGAGRRPWQWGIGMGPWHWEGSTGVGSWLTSGSPAPTMRACSGMW